MARDNYVETVASIAADGTLKAIANVQVTVKKQSDNSVADLFANRTGATGKANPFLTASDGLVNFWAEEDDYKVEYHDTQGPARIADFTVGWLAGRGEAAASEEFVVGDLKFSAISSDHGRWLRMDGRELTQAEIETALSLSAGEGAAIVAFLNTGSSTKYGSAASGKVLVPDTRRRMFMGAGTSTDTSPTPVAGTTARPLKGTGSSGGAETHQLSADESGVRKHSHTGGSLSAASHSHSAGSLSAASHSHSSGTLVGGSHSHGNGDLRNFIGNDINNAIFGGLSGVASVLYGPEADDSGSIARAQYKVVGSTSDASVGVSGSTGSTGATVSGTTASSSAAVSGNTGDTPTSGSGGDAAANSHNNMPPFVTIGYCFIRV